MTENLTHLTEIVKLEKELANYQGEDRVISFEEMDKRIKEQKIPQISAYPQFPQLNHLVDGFFGGELILISGMPKGGKTLLCQTFTFDLMDKGFKSLWFSYELPPKQFLERFPVIPLNAYMPAQTEVNNLWWIEKRILEAKLKYDCRAVFIDHLHFIIDMLKLHNPSLEIGGVLRGLKKIAIKYNVIVFLIQHIGKIQEGHEPTYHDIRDSSFSAQESDTVLLVWRLPDKGSRRDEAILLVEMTRRTGVLHQKIKLKKIDGWLREIEDVEVTQMEE